MAAPADYAVLALLLCGVPTLAAWAAASLIHRTSPRKAFDGEVGSRRVLPGVVSAVVALIVAAGSVVLADGRVHDAMILGLSSAVATTIVVLLFCRRRVPGRCVQCGYDIRGSLAFGRCPECGTSFLGGQPRTI